MDSNVERESMLLSVEERNEKRRKPCKVVRRKVKREETLQSGRKES